jgi:hypothetical protein
LVVSLLSLKTFYMLVPKIISELPTGNTLILVVTLVSLKPFYIFTEISFGHASLKPFYMFKLSKLQ